VEKFGSFGFAKGRLVCRAKPNVPFVRLAKIVFKKCAVGKNKNNEVLAKSVGLLAVCLQCRFYVFGHPSKWFNFSCLCQSF
jgi:hypothetical protein